MAASLTIEGSCPLLVPFPRFLPVTFQRYTPYLLALASGALQVVIFPSFRYYILAPLALVPLLIALAAETDRRKQLLLGTLAGCVFWGGMCYWIYDVMHRYAFLPAPAAAAIFAGFFLTKGLHSGIFALLAAPLLRRSWAIPGVAAAWVAVEGTHQYIFTWLHLGNAGISMATLARLAPWTGVYGLSFALAMMNVAIALVILRRPRRELAWLILLPLLYLLPAVPPPEAGRETVRLIQPNIHPDELLGERWTRRRAAEHLARMEALSTEAGSEPERASLLVWPEYPVPAYYFDDPGFEVFMTRLARKSRAYVVFNTVAFQRDGEETVPLNSAVTLDPDGNLISHYSKINLVPFGEFVPWPFSLFIEQITLEAGGFSPGDEVVLAPAGDHWLGTFICYESVFADGVRRFVAKGANVLINISNDSWYGRTAARGQHLLIARMRALENARWLLRATNDGVTAIIDPGGRVFAPLPSFREGVLSGRFNYSSRMTWFSLYGEWFWWLSMALTGGLLLLGLWRR